MRVLFVLLLWLVIGVLFALYIESDIGFDNMDWKMFTFAILAWPAILIVSAIMLFFDFIDKHMNGGSGGLFC